MGCCILEILANNNNCVHSFDTLSISVPESKYENTFQNCGN